MSEAPERIWVYAQGFRMWRDHKSDLPDLPTEYVRADRIEELEAKLANAVDVLEKIAKFDHQKEAQRILTMTVEQPAAMHIRAEKSEERVQAEYQLIKLVAQTDIQCWAHMAIAELTSSVAADNEVKGGKDE